MRTPSVYHIAFAFVLFAMACFFATSGVSSNALFDGFQKASAGVNGTPAKSTHSVKATASIAPFEGYTYAGQLDATITFADEAGEETVFDLHYPTDYNQFHDGYGPLWLANWQPQLSNNPQVSPVISNSCLQTNRGENLAPSLRYKTGYREYIVCRLLDEEGPDAPRNYDISKAKPAVIGIIWANGNHQPMDYPRERCVAEARIWSSEIAQAGDRFMACVFVINEDPQTVETYAFELTHDQIIEVGGNSESWPRSGVKTRAASELVQYRLMQQWLADPAAHEAAVARAYAHIAENLDQIVPDRVSKFEKAEAVKGGIKLTFAAKSTSQMNRIRAKGTASADRHLYQHIRKLACGSDEREALLAFQENKPTYFYDLNQADGSRMTMYARFSNMPC